MSLKGVVNTRETIMKDITVHNSSKVSRLMNQNSNIHYIIKFEPNQIAILYKCLTS